MKTDCSHACQDAARTDLPDANLDNVTLLRRNPGVALPEGVFDRAIAASARIPFSDPVAEPRNPRGSLCPGVSTH